MREREFRRWTPLREGPRGPEPRVRLAPEAAIVMGLERRLSREWDRADEVVLKRALTHTGLIERCVEPVDDARAAGTSRLVDYRIRIRAGTTTTTLEGGRDDPTRYGGPPAGPAGSVEAIEAVITVVDAEGTESTSVIATDVALTTGRRRRSNGPERDKGKAPDRIQRGARDASMRSACLVQAPCRALESRYQRSACRVQGFDAAVAAVRMQFAGGAARGGSKVHAPCRRADSERLRYAFTMRAACTQYGSPRRHRA